MQTSTTSSASLRIGLRASRHVQLTSWVWNCGQHLAREALDLPELVDRAEAADEVAHAAALELARATPTMSSGVPTGPQLERSIACESSG